jgi:hypothetical protein
MCLKIINNSKETVLGRIDSTIRLKSSAWPDMKSGQSFVRFARNVP